MLYNLILIVNPPLAEFSNERKNIKHVLFFKCRFVNNSDIVVGAIEFRNPCYYRHWWPL